MNRNPLDAAPRPSRFTRRKFLRAMVAATVAASVPPAFGRLGAPRRRVLVVIHLQGGNDGYNTVVPLHCPAYNRARPTLALRATDVLPLDGTHGLHPACAGLHQLFVSGRLAIVPSVGAPARQPARNHFDAEEHWETNATGAGWFSGFINASAAASPGSAAQPIARHAGTFRPQAFGHAHGDATASLAFADPAEFQTSPTGSPLDADLQRVSRLIAAGPPAQVYWLRAAGFDTHADQLRRHAAALADWSGALARFHRELASTGSHLEVTTLSYSEFGRSLAENQSGGTDHGDAGPVFLTGTAVTGGLHRSGSQLGLDVHELQAAVLQWLRSGD